MESEGVEKILKIYTVRRRGLLGKERYKSIQSIPGLKNKEQRSITPSRYKLDHLLAMAFQLPELRKILEHSILILITVI